MASKLDIPLHGSSLNIVRKCGPILSDILYSKFGCVATIDGVDFERDPSIAQQRTVAPEKRFAFKLSTGVLVSVWKADLTVLQADAVVNAANSRLQHYGGLARALSDAGGPQIQRESDDYISRYGKLKTGEAIVCGPGLLPCKMIIHAVGPYLSKSSDVGSAEPLLKQAIRSILDRVQEKRLKNVAIPAISSGLFNYPLPKCADTIVSTVKSYYKNSFNHGHLPEEILLVNNDEPTVKEMERACRQVLVPQQPMMYSQAAGGKSRGAANTPAPTVQIGNLLLTLKRDKIEEQRTDVIVNTASAQRELNIGQISKALLQKAGYGMQKEIHGASMKGCIIPTKPYKLECKEVYHTFCIEKGLTGAQEMLSRSVSECLWMAAANQHKSIAFPAIGTGALGFTKNEVAYIMSTAVADFAQKYPNKMKVDFVIFPSDHDTFQAFEEEMRCLRLKASHPSFAPAYEDRDVFHGKRASTPHISLSGPFDESAQEAEKWLSNLLHKSSGTVHIYNNFIQHFSEPEYLQLSRLIKKGLSIEEFFTQGHACMSVDGDSSEDVVVAALQVEAMLCRIQKEFVTEEEHEIQLLSTKKVSFERKTVDRFSKELPRILSDFKNQGLWLLKVDKVENPALELLFELKKKQLSCSTSRKMFQRMPAQFCEMVSRIGFHAECAPPENPEYGEGIYFAATPKKAMEVWKEGNEECLYFVEAEVLTGNSTLGKPGLILPPAVGTDPQILYDSVSGGPDVSVIFSGYQALPRHIIACKKAV